MPRAQRYIVGLGTMAAPSATSGLSAAQVLALIESSLGETLVEAPATGLGANSGDVFSFFPSSGHTFLPSPAASRMSTFFFGR